MTQSVNWQYRIIYFIHMPLFAFLSGLFIRDRKDCTRQIKRLVPIYLLSQGAAVLLFGASPIKPWWHLWYLLSLCCWLGAAWLLIKYKRAKLIILIAAIVISLWAGCFPFIGRVLSASRTLVFFPFFWLGVICDPETRWQKWRMQGIISLAVSVFLMVLSKNFISADFLYGASPYESIRTGLAMRGVCILTSALAGFFLLTWSPDIRFAFTKAGADTMTIYLIHAPAVMYLRSPNTHFLLCAVFSALLIYVIFKLTQWRGPLYSIAERKGRENKCRIFRRCMKNMQRQSTDFCSP